MIKVDPCDYFTDPDSMSVAVMKDYICKKLGRNDVVLITFC